MHTETPIGQARPGGRARAAARQPSARLPRVRQGWRVPAAGPGVQPRPRREPLRRGEASLREADPDQRSRLPRSRALHPVRPLHAVRRRGGRRQADPLHQPRQRDPGQHVPRRAVRQLLQRQHRADLPGGRADRQAVPLQGSARGISSRPRARAPHARSGAARSCSRAATSCCAIRASTAIPSTGAGCATGVGSTSRRSTAPTGSAAPMVRTADGLVADQLEHGARRGGLADRPSRSRPVAPAAIAVHRRRTRFERETRSRGRAWPTRSSAPRNVDAQMGDGLPVGIARHASGHHR